MDDSLLRLACSLLIFCVMAYAEWRSPRRELRFGRRRWPANLSIVVLNILFMRLLPIGGAAAVAVWAETEGFGLFNQLEWSKPVTVVCCVLLLDLVIYFQHRLFHVVPVLWRLHMVHHADRDIDVTTGLRFHPLEILLSMLIKMAVVAVLGAPVMAVFLFEVILNGMATFNHANVRLPLRIDAVVRRVLVTPDMHRVHHSVLPQETNSNYGFNLSIWDRWFNSYCGQPQHGHDDMVIGLAYLQDAPTHKLLYMLRLPFASVRVQYPQAQYKKTEE